MGKLIKLLNKPEYLLQPRTVIRRFLRRRIIEGIKVVQLPWRLPLEVNTAEAIGRTISHHGLFEISLVEAIFRLTDPSDVFLDVGANIGYMSSAALAAGASKVISFEPHPLLVQKLILNSTMWIQASPKIASRIRIENQAISNRRGLASLSFPRFGFTANQGIATLEAGNSVNGDLSTVSVEAVLLADVIEQCGQSNCILKIDIEGHEKAAFAISRDILASGRVRDILYEDHQGVDSEVSQLLTSFGYTLFGLNKTLFGPVLLRSGSEIRRFKDRSDEALNFLATHDSERALNRMSARGFQCLAGSRL
jgi:FkbM family methyltransferase